MKARRWVTLAAVFVIVLAAIVYGFIPKPVSVDVIKADRGPLRVAIEEEGTTRVIDRFVLSAPVAGFLRRIVVEPGDRVAMGQVVAELEPVRSEMLDPRSHAAAEAAVKAAESAVAAEEERGHGAKVEADFGQRNLERSRKLFNDGLISREAMDQAETAAKRANAALATAHAAARVANSELQRAQTALRYSAADSPAKAAKVVAIRAPVAGSILKIHHESEGIVQPGEPVLDIGDPRKMEVKVEALSTDAVRIKPGNPVIFTRWGGDETLSGVVRMVEPSGFSKISSLGVEEQRVHVIVDISPTDKQSHSLGDGFRLEANFVLWEGKDILQVPASALFRKNDGWAVFLIQGGKAAMREIKIGHRTGLAAEILAGLAGGETVISHPDNTIEEGKRVRPRQ